ncbi:unnamed protein product [Alopecurus aequalis]
MVLDLIIEYRTVVHLVRDGGCSKEFRTAMRKCRKEDADAEKCIKATAALRKCFAGNPECFGGDYFIGCLDHGLDQDLRPWQIKEDELKWKFRWWTGMRRS